MKRMFDIILSLIGIMVFLPAGLIIAALIRREDGQSVFFCQTRYGIGKKPFQIYKFRTMQNEVVTKFGAYLRRTGIDEVPQFLNVLKGEMSMVGPRPLPIEDIDAYRLFEPVYDLRWTVKPGVTGVAQLYYNKFNGAGPWLLDRRYIADNNLARDFCVVVVSFAANLMGKQAIRQRLWARRHSIRHARVGGHPE